MSLKQELIETLKQPLNGLEGLHEEFGELIMTPQEMLSYRHSPDFRRTIGLWDRLNVKSARTFGAIIANSRSLTLLEQSFTAYDFYKNYERVYDENTDSQQFIYRKQGQTLKDYVIEQAKRWQEARGGIPPRIALTEVFIRIFLQSWEGLLTEMISVEDIRENLPALEEYSNNPRKSLFMREPSSEEDRIYNCDIIIENQSTGRTELGIQIKPRSYFHMRDTTKTDKERNRGKDLKCEREKGFKVFYLDRNSSIEGEPLSLIYSESIVSPYDPSYRSSPTRGQMRVIRHTGDHFVREFVKSPYRGF